MVSLKGKRYENVYENNTNSSDEMSDDDSDYEIKQDKLSKTQGKYIDPSGMTEHFQNRYNNRNNNNNENKIRKKRAYSDDSVRTTMRAYNKRPRCYSKNALMARENRIKKKLYIENLEKSAEKYLDNNKKLTSILDNQSSIIIDLRKEVKYLKSVLANSSDITKLLKSINQNTGLPVTTSLNPKLSHPWTDMAFDLNPLHLNGELSPCDLSDFDDSNWNALFSDLLPLTKEVEPTLLLDHDDDNDVLFPKFEPPSNIGEHNYTSPVCDEFENAGICLHIARHKVSLEFCSTCSGNANNAWNEDMN